MPRLVLRRLQACLPAAQIACQKQQDDGSRPHRQCALSLAAHECTEAARARSLERRRGRRRVLRRVLLRRGVQRRQPRPILRQGRRRRGLQGRVVVCRARRGGARGRVYAGAHDAEPPRPRRDARRRGRAHGCHRRGRGPHGHSRLRRPATPDLAPAGTGPAASARRSGTLSPPAPRRTCSACATTSTLAKTSASTRRRIRSRAAGGSYPRNALRYSPEGRTSTPPSTRCTTAQ